MATEALGHYEGDIPMVLPIHTESTVVDAGEREMTDNEKAIVDAIKKYKPGAPRVPAQDDGRLIN